MIGMLYFVLSLDKGPGFLEKDINQMISSQDITKMKSISENDYTYDFFRNLPPNTKCEKTTDFQGGSRENAYYSTLLKNHPVAVNIKLEKSNFFNNKYTLLKLEVSSQTIPQG